MLRALPAAGVRTTTLRGALEAGCLHARPVQLPASSWGSGKDWRVWDGAQVSELVSAGGEVQRRLLDAVDKAARILARDPVLDALATQALLALSSDWAFMVTEDAAPHYARRRAALHARRVRELSELLAAGRRSAAARRAAQWHEQDDVFGHVDARALRLDGRPGHGG